MPEATRTLSGAMSANGTGHGGCAKRLRAAYTRNEDVSPSGRTQDGRANFGDIMQGSSGGIPAPAALLSKIENTAWMTGDPYHRVVLTANGNLQRLMSAWYDDKVEVAVVRNVQIEDESQWDYDFVRQYDRRVILRCGEAGPFCVATSRVILTTPQAVEAVESKQVGIAQLYHHFGILPHFYLIDAGAQDAPKGQRLWREYVLHGGGIECRIREDFRPNFLTLPPSSPPPAEVISSNSSPHLGDLMKGTICINTLSGGVAQAAHPLQRALLTATGNVVRILSSYHHASLTVGMLKSCRCTGDTSRFEREVVMFVDSIGICRAKTTVTLEDCEIAEAVESGACELGEVFRRFDLLPRFELLEVKLDSPTAPGFGRKYTLQAAGVSCEIVEEFSNAVLHLSEHVDNHTGPRFLQGIPSLF
eukprot:TRINITY_DN40160_c0_g2_i1.p1 TRINITY_DN40160_c0_g2~~TRINITY_DN40160_c0_g2_i1.p1  ORF type:complete len:418 (-),score=61.53 TRINITY_DN40160_c0_g2_i1:471-1724(-)